MVATAGRRVVVRDADGAERVCHVAGEPCVVGDRVRWAASGAADGRVVAVHPRESGTLRRSDRQGRHEVLATGLSGLFVVVAPLPPTWAGAIDRLLVAAVEADVDAVVVLNKTDLDVPVDLVDELAARRAVGVRTVNASARTGLGVDVLRAIAAESPGPWGLVGPSGAGKTSLIAALLPGRDVGAVGALSAYWGTGQHTTTGARRFDLPGGGALVDAPGIRSFQPPLRDEAALRAAFPGIRALDCRFRDCSHRHAEEGCVADSLPAVLLASYRRLLAELPDRPDWKTR